MVELGKKLVGRNNRRALRHVSICIFQCGLISSRPVTWIYTRIGQAVKGRVWPVNYAFYQSMFHRVDMYVIHVCLKIRIISNEVFPIASLPDTPLTPAGAHLADMFGFWYCFGEFYFY